VHEEKQIVWRGNHLIGAVALPLQNHSRQPQAHAAK